MGRTLFWYIFKDLWKIFLMTSMALAGILSFGGLLRPLTQQGLDAGQVGRILIYFTPAMTTYSFPVAALFAATVVYGRLSADNELTACRAGGISLGPFLGMAFPGLAFGLCVAIIDLLFLCFIVPVYTLEVEKVVYSNLARLIATRVDRTHKIELGDAEVFAQRAIIPPTDPAHPDQQRVVLEGVSIVTYTKLDKRDPRFAELGFDKHPRMRVIHEFWLASNATVDIDNKGTLAASHDSANDAQDVASGNQVRILVSLVGGNKFPRELEGGMQAGIGETQFGPMYIGSPIKEDPKFMTVNHLKWLYEHPEKSEKIATVVDGYVRRDQGKQYMSDIYGQLNSPTRTATFAVQPPRTFTDTGAVIPPPTGEKLQLTITTDEEVRFIPGEGVDDLSKLIVTGMHPNAVRLEDDRPNEPPIVQESKDLLVYARPDPVGGIMNVTIELLGRTPAGATRPTSEKYTEVVSVAMSPQLAKLDSRPVDLYFWAKDPVTHKSLITSWDLSNMKRELLVLLNGLLAESNSRASLAISCVILVLVGCSLGMMFRTGNFLGAFALSFIPALLCITLIVAGQQTCKALPWQNFELHNPLRMGIGLIWGGNIVNGILASCLLLKLQRQ